MVKVKQKRKVKVIKMNKLRMLGLKVNMKTKRLKIRSNGSVIIVVKMVTLRNNVMTILKNKTREMLQ